MKNRWTPWGALPLFIWQIFFLTCPVAVVVVYSFLRKGSYGGILFDWNVLNYVRAFDGIYLLIFLQSVRLAFITALMCLVIGFPIAWMMARSHPVIRKIFIIALVLPFLTNCVIRACALKVILGPHGPLNLLINLLGMNVDPIVLTDTLFAVWIGLVSNYLPFFVLPIYVTLDRIDFCIFDAARDLGASPMRAFLHVILPLLRQGLMTGFMLVFIPALCEFLIPDFLGGARNLLLGGLIAEQFLKARDWPFGSALSMILLMLVFCFFVAQRLFALNSHDYGKKS